MKTVEHSDIEQKMGWFPDEGEPLALQLAHLFPALWRSLVDATKAAQDMPTMDSQVAILRMLVNVGPMTPAELADELHLARSTVSTLIGDLTRQTLVERRPSPVDGRSAIIHPTERGKHVLETFRNDRTHVVDTVLASLSDADVEMLRSAMPALRQLLEQFRVAARDVASA